MKTSILFATALAASLAASTARAQSTFPDVPDNHWAAQAVRRLAEAGIIEGLPATAEKRTAPAAQAPAAPKSVARRAVSTVRRASAAKSARVAVR